MKCLIIIYLVSALLVVCKGEEDNESNKTSSKERILKLHNHEPEVSAKKQQQRNTVDGDVPETQTVKALEEKVDRVHITQTEPEQPPKQEVALEEEGSGNGLDENEAKKNNSGIGFLVEESGEEKIIKDIETKMKLVDDKENIKEGEEEDEEEDEEDESDDDSSDQSNDTKEEEMEIQSAVEPTGQNLDKPETVVIRQGPTPKALFYCFNTATHGRYVYVRMDPNGIGYKDVYAVTSDGERASGCSKEDFEVTEEGIMSLTISSEEDRFDPNCGVNEEDDGVFTWRFRFQQLPRVESIDDVIFTLRCNFTNGEPLWRGANPATTNGHVRNLELESASEDVRLDILDSRSKKPIDEAILGQDVKLKMALYARHELSATGISPFSCTANSPDGKQNIELTDLHGCGSDSSPLSTLTGDGSAVETRSFRIFKFPGIDEVILKCYFDFCFDSDNLKCEDRCKYFSLHANRGKRAVSKKQNYAVKSIRVYADPDKYALAEARHHNSNTVIQKASIPAYIIAMMGILFLLLLCATCAVIFMYIRLKDVRRRNSSPVPTAGDDDDMSVTMDWGDETEKL